MPDINLDPKVRYVTQQNVFATQVKGPLTDKAIERYRKAGYYGSGLKSPTEKVRQAKKKRKRISHEKLFAKFLA